MKMHYLLPLACVTSLLGACGKTDSANERVDNIGGSADQGSGGKGKASGGARDDDSGGDSGGGGKASSGGSGGGASGGLGQGGEGPEGDGGMSSGNDTGGNSASGGAPGEECDSVTECAADQCSRATCEQGVCGTVPLLCEAEADASCVADALLSSEPSCVAPITDTTTLGSFVACSGPDDQCTTGDTGCDVRLSVGEVAVESDLEDSLRTTTYRSVLTEMQVAGSIAIQRSGQGGEEYDCEFTIELPADPPVPVEVSVISDVSEGSCESTEVITNVEVDIDLSSLNFSLGGSAACRLLTAVAGSAWTTARSRIQEQVVDTLTDSLLSYGECQSCAGACEGLSCEPGE